MGSVVLYIAASMDGYIATEDGGVEWLNPFNEGGEDYGYKAFEQTIGATIMGGKTYRQALGFREWSYKGMSSYIVTSQPLADHPDDDVRKVEGDFPALVQPMSSICIVSSGSPAQERRGGNDW